MKVIRFMLKYTAFCLLAVLAILWAIFFGAFGVAMFASVLFAPVGVVSFGLAAMPLFALLSWMGWRSPSSSSAVVHVHNNS